MEDKIYNAKVDDSECVGCEACCEIAPEVFRLNGEGKAEAYGQVTEANREKVVEAFESCPVGAITWDRP